MPKLAKIRLTGCKYDGLKKEHENSIFDLTRDGQADHALFTLFNGGGKGVMMQLIFQLLLPETKWGKNNGNKVISMFYDQRNNLHPFTFHVVLEWILDTVPEKRLITGIAIKAIIKNTGNEEEDKTGLSLFLYTHEHDNKGYFKVENLPLYDKETGEAVDIDKLEDFIDSNKRDFIKYSQSNVKKKDGQYYAYLESKGIYRSEWINLKAINKSEGGAGDYFIGASDNKSVFDKIIIPAISENLRNYNYENKNSLIEMFKSNLSITKDLPVLIKREGDFKDLLVAIKPLIENADSGSRFLDMKERLINEGNDIFFILSEEENYVKQEIDKWGNEEKRAKDEGKNLIYNKDNLLYNQEKKDLESEEKEMEQLVQIFKDLDEEVKGKNKDLLLYKINKETKVKKELDVKISNKYEEKERLLETLNISDIQKEAEILDFQLEKEWNIRKSVWYEYENQYRGYLTYAKQNIDQNKIKIKEFGAEVDNLNREVVKYEFLEAELERYRNKLELKYDAMSLLFPDRIAEDLNKEKKKNDLEITSLKNNISSYKERINIIHREIDKLKDRLKTGQEDVKKLRIEADLQRDFEIKVAHGITKQLLENYDGSVLDHHWFAKKQEALLLMEDIKKAKLEEVQRTIWEKNIDRLLNKDNYFVPNKDIVMVKDEIKRLGINVETGAEYFTDLKNEEKLEILNNYPGFIYGVVISNIKDWQSIERNIDKEIFLNNMVPIYVRSEMSISEKEGYRSLWTKAFELIDQEKYLIWKNTMEDVINKLSETESSIKIDLKNIDDLKQELRLIESKDTAWILNQKLREREKEIDELSNELNTNEEEEIAIINKLNLADSKLNEKESSLLKIIDSIKEIEDYIERKNDVEQEQKRITLLKKDIQNIKEEIRSIEDEIDGIMEERDNTSDEHRKWESNIKNIIEKVREVYKDATYTYKVDSSYVSYKAPIFLQEEDQLNSLISQRKALENDIASRNSNIASIDIEIRYLNMDLTRQINVLKELDENWEVYRNLDLAVSELALLIKETDKKINRLQDEKYKKELSIQELKGSIKEKRKKLQELENQIFKNHKKPAVTLDIVDIRSEIDSVERDIKSNEKYLKMCIQTLEKNKESMVKLEINLNKIKTGYSIEIGKGKIDSYIKEKIQLNPGMVVEDWVLKCDRNKDKIDKTIKEGDSFRNRFIEDIGSKLEEDKLKEKIINAIKEAKIPNFKSNVTSFKSMENHFQQEILRLSNDKAKAEEAMKQWTNRASIHVIRMVEALKTMVSSMNYTNEQGYAFPLVKLKGMDRLPKNENEITSLLKEYFIQAISKISETNQDISNIEDKEFIELMGDKVIFSKALQGRYPTLLVYKMSEKNEFRYARARDEYYTTWEAINKGEGDLPEGSGGQTLSVNTFVIMMIMSFKKKHIGNENPSTVLVLDNPFGKASAKHVLDPIFEIANKLNFQLICFAAPEIIKVEISERFPVFWELKIHNGKVVHGGRIIKHGLI
ncbi:chromosome segregation ATPase [Serpentinicella alkaliphila]|uniref:Chromosome segregation ATPase n=2 Tax=Serpentinicella alkaliphila TaxID=1734049 RepID=A0A4R2TC10_9FIRM|nr:chromosome segregation ATPase [Serpentinicella alkaliphila]